MIFSALLVSSALRIIFSTCAVESLGSFDLVVMTVLLINYFIQIYYLVCLIKALIPSVFLILVEECSSRFKCTKRKDGAEQQSVLQL